MLDSRQEKQGPSKQVWNLISSENQGRKQRSSGGGEGWWMHRHGVGSDLLSAKPLSFPLSNIFKASLSFFFFLPPLLGYQARVSTTVHLRSSVHSQTRLVPLRDQGLWPRALSGRYRLSHLRLCRSASERRPIRAGDLCVIRGSR